MVGSIGRSNFSAATCDALTNPFSASSPAGSSALRRLTFFLVTPKLSRMLSTRLTRNFSMVWLRVSSASGCAACGGRRWSKAHSKLGELTKIVETIAQHRVFMTSRSSPRTAIKLSGDFCRFLPIL